MSKDAVETQGIGAIAETVNRNREEALQTILSQINAKTTGAVATQEVHLAEALNKIATIQTFIDNPENILGNSFTKHGEIAEQVEVGITNARAALRGLGDIATADPDIVGRTVNAPADYVIDGRQVQSKFINGEANTLKHILEHLQTYRDIDFARGDGSYYHIPIDQFQSIQKILEEGTLEGRSPRSIDAIMRGINRIEDESGQRFTDIVRAAQTGYKDVQLDKIQETIDGYRQRIANENDQIIRGLKDSAEIESKMAIDGHQPSWSEATNVAIVGAAVSGGLTLAIDVYKKMKDGKELSQFTLEDWKEVGLHAGERSLRGGITGYAVYGLTNLANMSAPVASGLVSVSFGMNSLINDYRQGKIGQDELVENSFILCVDTGIVTVGSLIGQAVIPIPVVGAVVGSLTTNIMLDLAKDMFNQKEMELLIQYRSRVEEQVGQLDREVAEFVHRIAEDYYRLGGILEMAFDKEINCSLRFQYSQQLAMAYGVPAHEVLMTVDDADDYFLK